MENLINKDMPCSSYCWLANRYAIVTQIPSYLHFIWDELNMALLEANSRIYFIGKNSSKEINSHFMNLLIFSELSSLDVLQFCEESLRRGKYILIKVDKFYIKACPQYNVKHEFFEILVYGGNEKGFCFLNLNERTKLWDARTLSANELYNGFLNVLSLRNNDYYEFLKIFEGNESLCVSVEIKKNLKSHQKDCEFLTDIMEIGRQFSDCDAINSVAGIPQLDFLIIYLKVLIDIRIMLIKKIYLLSSVKFNISYYVGLCNEVISIYRKRLMILVKHSIKSYKAVRDNLIEDTVELINKSEKQFWMELYNDVRIIE